MDDPNSQNNNSAVSPSNYRNIVPYIEAQSPEIVIQPETFQLVVPQVLPKTQEPIVLCPYQEPHVKKLNEIFQTSYVGLDFSKTGRGKTYTASALATYYKYPIILIAPRTLFSVWKEMETKHGVIIENKISYALLRGIHGKKCNHPYLTRTSNDGYLATPYLISRIDEGRLFVFDEMSKLKNQTSQSRKAAHAIIKTIVSRKSSSRVLLLSALPTNEPIHVLTLMQLLGIIYVDNFVEYDKSGRTYHLTGIQEVIDWCYKRNPDKTREIINQHSTTSRQSIMEMSTELYYYIISDHLSSCMVVDNPVDLDIKNGYYPIDSENLAILKQGQRILNDAIRYRGDQLVNPRTINWGMITRGIKLLGKAKLKIMAQMARVFLISNPSSKGVICVWFVSHIKWLAEALKGYGVETLYGKTKMKQRKPVVDRFQDPDSDCRIIIINPTVGGMGISLDDRDGNHPRWMLLMPDYRIMDLVQCTGRVNRKSTLSKEETIIRFVYTKAFKTESRILSSLHRKSEAARIVISDRSGIRLPDSYHIDNQIEVLPEFSTPLPPLPDPEEVLDEGFVLPDSLDNNLSLLRI
uniref:DEAD/SNF2-like helicase n=1 Tax=Pithovirus LCPAC201 TaxID=2506591 RepID=A0A481Z656_9VIRU|nr:MAG: DEAD/SNF2-like helicase [Pithovirus LCPAC201]